MFNNNSKKIKKMLKMEVNPEDLLLDEEAENSAGLRYEFKIEEEFPESRWKSVVLFFALISFLIFGKIFSLAFVNYEQYKERALANAARVYPVAASRGIIYDRNLKQIAFNVLSFDIIVIPKDLRKGDIELIASKISDGDNELNLKIINLFNNLDFSSLEPVLILSSDNMDKMLALKKNLNNIEGLRIELRTKRHYSSDYDLAHVLGYIGRVSKDDIRNNFHLYNNDYIGKTGLEFFYDNILRGENGRRKIDIDALANIKKESVLTEARSGENLVLNIDADYQKKLSELLLNKIKEPGNLAAAAVLTDLEGKILSLVSVPDYDNNIFLNYTGGVLSFENNDDKSKSDKKDFFNILTDNGQPMFNRAISGEYFPGSTIKPLIAAAALEEGIIDKNTKINSSKNIEITSRYDSSVVYKFKDWADHGVVDLNKALAVSSNIFFYTVGGGNKNFKGLGVDKIKNYLNQFNLGRLLNIDLPNEKEGFVPSADWKEKTYKEKWFTGDTYNLSTGEAYLTVTPLQMTMALVSIVNGGLIYKPRLLSKIVDNNFKDIKVFESEIIKKIPIDQNNLALIREGMKGSATYGTAKVLSSLPFETGAKTGTAQLGDVRRSWTISFAPYDKPKMVLTVLVEGGTGGGTTAAPIVRDFFEWLSNNKPPHLIDTVNL